MSPHELVEVFVVQDRKTGLFFDCNMSPVKSLRFAARADSITTVHDSMNFAILEGQCECEEGYEIHAFYESSSRQDY